MKKSVPRRESGATFLFLFWSLVVSSEGRIYKSDSILAMMTLFVDVRGQLRVLMTFAYIIRMSHLYKGKIEGHKGETRSGGADERMQPKMWGASVSPESHL